VSVNEQGVVGVSWQDRQERPTSLGWRERFAASTDGGQTFLPSVAVGTGRMRAADDQTFPLYPDVDRSTVNASRYKDAPITLDMGLSGHPITGGETTGLTYGPDGVFHALWVDDRTGLLQIWTAPITVNGTVTRNGDELVGF